MTLLRWSPFTDLEPIHQQINQLFEQARRNQLGDNEGLRSPKFIPPVNVHEDDDNIYFSLEIPGMKKEDFTINLEDKVLSISGERKFEHEDKKDNFHRVERVYGSFNRSFTIGKPVVADNITATYTDGILNITVPKAEETKPKQISVTVG